MLLMIEYQIDTINTLKQRQKRTQIVTSGIRFQNFNLKNKLRACVSLITLRLAK